MARFYFKLALLLPVILCVTGQSLPEDYHHQNRQQDKSNESDGGLRKYTKLSNSYPTWAREEISNTFVKTNRYHGSRSLTTASGNCLRFGTFCNSSSNCCQGGCSSNKTCFCQANDGMCFNRGGNDSFCCSNRCGSNGRCECSVEGMSCASDSYCCNELKCGDDGTCITLFSALSEPTKLPIAKPTDIPVISPSAPVITQFDFSNSCQTNGGLCFSPGEEDFFCCSNLCGANGRCKCLSSGKSCENDSCCNGLKCGVSGICIPQSSPDTTKPTLRPTTKATVLPTNGPSTKPYLSPTPKPSPKPTPSLTQTPISKPFDTTMGSRTNICSNGNIKVTIEIQTDQYGSDTSWFLAKSHRTNAPIINVKQGTYNSTTFDKKETCIAPGTKLNFTVYDEWGDGLCCGYGDGFVKAYLDDREIMYVTSFGKSMTEIINVGFDFAPNMTTRELLYLEAHNRRRKEWHESNNVTYVPLFWSPQLAEEARIWAEELLVNCSSHGIEHEKGVEEGENLAKNVGRDLTWGQLYPPNNIVGRWVDWEVNRPYPGNAHLTQALWRASHYLGCGESEKDFRSGKCRVQVCRYARAGNCDMARYNSTKGKNWLPPMLADTSRCGPTCPPEGCF
mmetsp:Transcript_31299/g.65438  ORF Transcript_31299/g.65438 Transcript_31299/m.65438 type:complete len:619 (-) Transcript_31299:195-2051(-)